MRVGDEGRQGIMTPAGPGPAPSGSQDPRAVPKKAWTQLSLSFPQDPSLEPPKMAPPLRAGRGLRVPSSPMLSELGGPRGGLSGQMAGHHTSLPSFQSLGPRAGAGVGSLSWPVVAGLPTPLRSVHATEEAAGTWGRKAWQQCRVGQRRAGPVTFLVHCLTVLISSEITMSTHLRHGSRIFFTCFFTMVSKAMSGVNSPVLNARSGRRAQCHRPAPARSDRPGPLPNL